jgi:hypothetical protein
MSEIHSSIKNSSLTWNLAGLKSNEVYILLNEIYYGQIDINYINFLHKLKSKNSLKSRDKSVYTGSSQD